MITKNTQRKEYLSRINRVQDYVDNNISSKFTLEELSSVANFSKYHFHRIFNGIMGETLNNYILRIRLEKAATVLICNPNVPITDICFNCGFSSSSVFARAFKDKFKLSASVWRQNHLSKFSNISQSNSNISEVSKKLDKYFGDILFNTNGEARMKEVIEPTNIEVKEMEEFTVAYIRYIGPYKGDSELFSNLFTRIFNWAGPKGLCQFPKTKVLSVYHDNPDITDEDKLRVSICISVPESTKVDGEIGKMNIAGGKYAVTSFELTDAPDYEKAWTYIFSEWLPTSGYMPDDKPSYELYLNNPKEHLEKKHIVDICVPVKPM
jgi:AraC family transcriptional regulator